MFLQTLIASLLHKHVLGAPEAVEIRSITSNSKEVTAGSLFVAIVGNTVDGHTFLPEVCDKGAVAVLVERACEDLPNHVVQIVVPSTRKAVAIVASVFYRQPSKEMKVIGVTGTNGKTTTTHLIEKVLSDCGFTTGLIGTIHMRIGQEVIDVANTTPEALELQKTFRTMCDRNTTYCIMEVSSHALELYRVAGTHFRTAIFTNLTQDHLDFHGTMEQYRNAKGKFFSRLGNTYEDSTEKQSFAVINRDDPHAEFFLAQTVAPTITYGIDQPSDVRALDVHITAEGVFFRLETFAGSAAVQLRLTGKFSVYNALAAIAACLIESIPLPAILHSLEQVDNVPGRFEKVEEGQPFTVIVDYSHTPDSLENALKTIQEFAKGKIWTVVGCGGDRDRSKRPIMAKIAATYSDTAILTSDNPRTEDPDRILDDMEAGLQEIPNLNYFRLADRKQAIRYAIEHADPSDCILIAGKGHETYQIIGKTKYHFDDREIARSVIRGMGQ
ncbi:UDP-N-acetylmuramoyl-L-alanyl-D-glutamate--2,6-diaminopimelate ligase [Fodinisporobacter ferrooxydans]|uniref:UDP-N-acetylmuramoyl-L-alanyl-D-glutamate--2,6-diaminopimelate ligase n=1 Tax=Fodinisporobacter ferrooxydans TaxID=2901836 RepID=A0ABY4CI82_9BACL|nr:UDP-N-acetylmuramoyl-L-alanyl-D-glutamate--2,6-diaminopimelate ligase [Alicyclobacillaceae bacterium MYW30-H2]